MDPISSYIQQARQQGFGDEQIRQALIAAGWPVDQVNAAFAPPVALPAYQPLVSAGEAQPQVKQGSKLPLLIVGILILLIVVGGVAFAALGRKTSYQTAIQQFITAMHDNKKAATDAMVSPAFKAELKKDAGTSSVYDSCHQNSALCLNFFSPSFLNKAILTHKTFQSKGVQVEEETYTLKQKLTGEQAGGQGCTSSSTTTLSISAIPNGKSWLISDVEPSLNASADICAGDNNFPTESN